MNPLLASSGAAGFSESVGNYLCGYMAGQIPEDCNHMTCLLK
jgi:hypothetical protein